MIVIFRNVPLEPSAPITSMLPSILRSGGGPAFLGRPNIGKQHQIKILLLYYNIVYLDIRGKYKNTEKGGLVRTQILFNTR